MNVTACVIVIIVNNSLQRYGGDMAIGAYGIMNRLLVLYVMIVLGLTMGMQPIVGVQFRSTEVRPRKRLRSRLEHPYGRVHHQYGLYHLRTVSACRIGCLYQ